MNTDDLSTERKFMLLLRKTFASVVRETAPRDGVSSPFSEQTIEDIRLCLSLISERERALAAEDGAESQMRPRFVDEPQQTAQVVTLHTRKKES
ncbi:segregation and condensation protein A [Candidatus Albibeggiatoa sp. nov. NOAA]|uniref:segregation and condensation protein A n=1 Tax=Candidatus Albibeggiatoa sp. nov. NOAA TaxID=3162724 RepID=UPI0033029434|nr:segregation and condensation protein A [Thiotrichaceae bacterium]